MSPDDAVRDAYLAHAPDLFRFLRHQLRNDSEAADLVQESFARWLEVIRHAGVAIRDPRAFLFRVARTMTQDRWRARARRASRLDDPRVVDASAPLASPDREAEGRQRLSRLVQAVEELPPRCREAFILHKFHGLPHAAVAARMGVSRNMVEKHVIQALRHIRTRTEPLEPSRPDRDAGILGPRDGTDGSREQGRHLRDGG